MAQHNTPFALLHWGTQAGGDEDCWRWAGDSGMCLSCCFGSYKGSRRSLTRAPPSMHLCCYDCHYTHINSIRSHVSVLRLPRVCRRPAVLRYWYWHWACCLQRSSVFYVFCGSLRAPSCIHSYSSYFISCDAYLHSPLPPCLTPTSPPTLQASLPISTGAAAVDMTAPNPSAHSFSSSVCRYTRMHVSRIAICPWLRLEGPPA